MQKPAPSKNVHPIGLLVAIIQRSQEVPPPPEECYKAIAGTPCMIFGGNYERYGSIEFNGKRYIAHKVMFEASVGELLPSGQVVRHKCDRRGCVNLAHLESGTHLDNFLDSQRRKRNPAFGARNGMNLYPWLVPRGLRKYGRPLTQKDAADIKQCLGATKSPTRRDFISIAASFATTPDLVEAISRGDDYEDVPASGTLRRIIPLSRENLTVPFPGLKRQNPTQSQVADMRWEYFVASNSDRRALKLAIRSRYGISRATLNNVLTRETFKDVAPEIPVLNEQGSGVAVLSDREVQSIRATWTTFPDLHCKGLAAALVRIFGVSHQSIQRIIDREQRKSVPDDPARALTLEQLPFKSLHQKGEQHPQRKLNAEQVREIRRLKEECQLTNRAIAALFKISPPLVGMILKRKIWREVE